MEEKAWKGGGMADMKPRLGFWIAGEEKSESGDTTFPATKDDSTWQSPYMFTYSDLSICSFFKWKIFESRKHSNSFLSQRHIFATLSLKHRLNRNKHGGWKGI